MGHMYINYSSFSGSMMLFIFVVVIFGPFLNYIDGLLVIIDLTINSELYLSLLSFHHIFVKEEMILSRYRGLFKHVCFSYLLNQKNYDLPHLLSHYCVLCCFLYSTLHACNPIVLIWLMSSISLWHLILTFWKFIK